MASWFNSAPARLTVGLAGVVALGAGLWFAFGHREDGPGVDPASLPFRECATDVGISWRMNFLSTEQGEDFKINLYDHGCGLAVGDFDGDGHEDLYFCNQLGRNALYLNKGDGTFEDVTDKAGVGLGDRVCVAATFVDYDNSGRQSLFVTSARGGNVFFKNLGDGRFQDATRELGLEHVGHSQTAVFFDYDNDGFLDLYLVNTASWTSDTYLKLSNHWAGKGEIGGGGVMLSTKEHNRLYHNVPVDPADPKKGRKFVDVTEHSGLEGRGWAGDAVAFDYDGDGKMDLFVTSMFGRCQLYHNLGNGKFQDVTLKVLGRTPWGAIGAKVFDFNNDGRLDLYVVDMHSDMWMGLERNHESLKIAREDEQKKFAYFNGPYALKDPRLIEREKELGRQLDFKHEELLFGNGFYRNEGGGKFTEISDQAGLENFWPWGIGTGDFDNDGNEDIFLTAGMGYPFYYWPNYLLMNQGNGTFVNRAAELNVAAPRGEFQDEKIGGQPAARSSRCVVTGDFRGVGLLDIVTNNFNDQPYYLKNQLPRRNYVEFRLRGTRSNRDAIGAVVRLYQGTKILTRQVDAACGYLSHSSRTLHFGLGDQPNIDRVVITWPSGSTQTLEQVSANTRHAVVEPEGAEGHPK